jgi:hypothetical protein
VLVVVFDVVVVVGIVGFIGIVRIVRRERRSVVGIHRLVEHDEALVLDQRRLLQVRHRAGRGRLLQDRRRQLHGDRRELLQVAQRA